MGKKKASCSFFDQFLKCQDSPLLLPSLPPPSNHSTSSFPPPVPLPSLPLFLTSTPFPSYHAPANFSSLCPMSHCRVPLNTTFVAKRTSLIFIYLNFISILNLFSVCIKTFGDRLTTFEQSEILDHPEVWFLGLEANKIEAIPGTPYNNGTVNRNCALWRMHVCKRSRVRL